MRKIVFDIETSNSFQDTGQNDPASLSIAVVGIYDYERDAYKSYTVEELPELWPILENADMLIGYNSDHFDLPLLNKYYPGDLYKIKSLDLLREIQKSAGRRMKLDQIAQGTLGTQKLGNGIEALNWWRRGEVDKVRDYCLHDVRITKDVYDYALKNGKIIFKEGPNTNEVKLDTSEWEVFEDTAMNKTLPF